MPNCGTLTVTAAFDPSNVSVTQCSFTPQEIEVGNTTTVEWTLQNGNSDASAEVTVAVTVDGTQLHQQTYTVGPNGTTTDSTTVGGTLGEGSHQIDVSVTSAASAASQTSDGVTRLSRIGTSQRTGGAAQVPGCSTCGH